MAGEIDADDFQRNVAIEFVIARQVDLAHPTLPELLHDRITVAEAAAGCEDAGEPRRLLAARSSDDGRVQKIGFRFRIARPRDGLAEIRQIAAARDAARGIVGIFCTALRT